MGRGTRLSHCFRGHPYDSENTAYYMDGTRRCKACRRLTGQKSYQKHREKRVAKARAWNAENMPAILARNKARRQERKRRFMEMMGGCCARCGYAEHPAALDFDHLDPSRKTSQIGRMIGANAPDAAIIAELAACQLLCANCHRIRTHDPEAF